MKAPTFRPWVPVLLVGFHLAAPTFALAAESYDNCTGFVDTVPATINTQGTWCLRRDLATGITSGAAITIGTNNVTLDCNHFKVGGLTGGLATQAYGISASGKYNATIRNCNVRGFRSGVAMQLGGGHLIEHNNLDGNTHRGISITSGGSTVRGNRVVDTGLSSTIRTEAMGIFAVNGVDIIDNTINGVAASGANSDGSGIFMESNGDGVVLRNRLRGILSSGTGEARGIYHADSARLIIRDNDVQGTGAAGSIGVSCGDNTAIARDNVIAGFATALERCFPDGNTIDAI